MNRAKHGGSLLLAVASVALILSACGSSSPHVAPPTSTPVQPASHPAGAEPNASASSTQPTKGHGKQRSESSSSPRAATSSTSGGATKKTVPVAVPKGPNPCVLMSRSEAEAAVGASITKITEAPLGPTCILQVQGQKQTITVAVESGAAASQVHQMRKVQHLAISGHNAYCGVLGRPMLNVPLGNGKLLNVTAPCSIAQALAAKALPRIAA